MRTQGSVVAQFQTPTPRTSKAKAAIKMFDRVADSLGALDGEIADAHENGATEQAKAVRANVAAVTAGKQQTVDLDALRQKHEAQVAKLEARRPAIEEVVDATGDAMIAAIVADREKWIEAIAPAGEKAAARFSAALEETREALAELSTAQSEKRWLVNFIAEDALIGWGGQYPGALPAHVDTTEIRRRDNIQPADGLLALAATAVEES